MHSNYNYQTFTNIVLIAPNHQLKGISLPILPTTPLTTLYNLLHKFFNTKKYEIFCFYLDVYLAPLFTTVFFYLLSSKSSKYCRYLWVFFCLYCVVKPRRTFHVCLRFTPCTSKKILSNLLVTIYLTYYLVTVKK